MDSILLPKGVVVVQLPQYIDERGTLNVLNFINDLPFAVQRTFWISQVPENQTRGGHAHRTSHEAVFAVSGSFELTVDDGVLQHTFLMNKPSKGVVIPAGVWCELSHFSPGTICLAVASEPYRVEGYINNKTQWLQYIKEVTKRY